MLPDTYLIGKYTGAKALKYITDLMVYHLKECEVCELAEKVKMCGEFKHFINCEE